jgi:predicted PhzF superfamily epimerase YddE/YHI9
MTSLTGLNYCQVDVFTHEALAGNGLTVFLPDSPLARPRDAAPDHRDAAV